MKQKIAMVFFWCVITFSSNVYSNSVRKLTLVWENALVSQSVMIYFSLSLLNDLYHAKKMDKIQTRNVLAVITDITKKTQTECHYMKVKGSSSAQRFFRKVRTTYLFLNQAIQALHLYLEDSSSKKYKDFITLRDALTQDIQGLFSRQNRKKQRIYRGGKRTSLYALSKHLTRELTMAYSAIGLVADGFFLGLLGKQQTLSFLATMKQALQINVLPFAALPPLFSSSSDKMKLLYFLQSRQYLLEQLVSLQQFIPTRNKDYLRIYKAKREKAWASLQWFTNP